ncbi:MAG TPA: hypothetical protein DFS52_22755 [Myxococcales bacterium]|nr:hypothetical protein [Myxococcales bacterium]
MHLRIPSPNGLAAASLTTLALLAASPALAAERAFGPAETLTFECKYLGLPVGKVHTIVGADTKIEGETVWPVMAVAKTDPVFVLYPIKDKYITWWNPEERLTLGNELSAEEKNERRRERIRFDRQKNKAMTRRDRPGQPRDERDFDIPPGSQDILAALFAIREKKLEVGDHEEMPIFTGRRVFTLKVDVEGKAKVETKAGRFDTKLLRVQVEFSGQLATKRDLRIFVTDDPRHVPVRMDAEFLIGTLAADLVSYQKGITAY